MICLDCGTSKRRHHKTHSSRWDHKTKGLSALSSYHINSNMLLYHLISCHIISCLVIPCQVMSRLVTSHRSTSHHAIWHHVASCHLISYRVMSCHIISCGIISQVDVKRQRRQAPDSFARVIWRFKMVTAHDKRFWARSRQVNTCSLFPYMNAKSHFYC